MKIVIIDDDNLVSLSLNTILSAQDDIELVAEGLNNKEIADELYLSEGTVRNYISVILEKLQLRDRTQLACFYYKSMV